MLYKAVLKLQFPVYFSSFFWKINELIEKTSKKTILNFELFVELFFNSKF